MPTHIYFILNPPCHHVSFLVIHGNPSRIRTITKSHVIWRVLQSSLPQLNFKKLSKQRKKSKTDRILFQGSPHSLTDKSVISTSLGELQDQTRKDRKSRTSKTARGQFQTLSAFYPSHEQYLLGKTQHSLLAEQRRTDLQVHSAESFYQGTFSWIKLPYLADTFTFESRLWLPIGIALIWQNWTQWPSYTLTSILSLAHKLSLLFTCHTN